jgi:two-component system, sensor histidine kinase
MLDVLIVEDDDDSREMLSEIITVLGYRAHTARDYPQAIAAVGKVSPHVAFVDLGLPGVDGCEIARRLRAHPACGSLYLVALTGYGNPEDEAATRAAGFNEHLLKPLGVDRVRRVLSLVQGS